MELKEKIPFSLTRMIRPQMLPDRRGRRLSSMASGGTAQADQTLHSECSWQNSAAGNGPNAARRHTGLLIVAIVLFCLLSSSIQLATAAENSKDLPLRAISIAPEYTGVAVAKGEDVSIDLIVKNGGRRDENIFVTVTSVPAGWQARIKTYRFEVTGIHVPSDDSKNLTFELEPDKSVAPGKYSFAVTAKTDDGKLTASCRFNVEVKEKSDNKKAKGLTINTSYPVLQGPTDARFEFSLEVQSEMSQDAIVNTRARQWLWK
ncbi:MAG: hypothetical protein JRJ12_17395 [Deltaproteobacteria bacterium]|nr:hypothetical protein [Deltaproteobacteria bacterium]